MNNIDIKENYIYQLDNELLGILLLDRTSGKTIIWATDNYASRGTGYMFSDHISVAAITGYHGNVIKPRTESPRKSNYPVFVIKQKCLLPRGFAISRITSLIMRGLEKPMYLIPKRKTAGLHAKSPYRSPQKTVKPGKTM